jgi:glycerophosphoryl diester phosphodiesterase
MRTFERPLAVVGHRGAGESIVSGLPENSLESCRAAHERGAGWVELDARLTADGELVLHHDHVLPSGLPVDEATVDDCRAQGVAGFDELLDGLPDGLGVDLEVKVSLRDASGPVVETTGGRVAARARELRSSRPVIITSFSPAALLQAREVAADEVPLGLLGLPVAPLGELVPSAVALGADLIAPHVLTFGIVEVAGLPLEPVERVRRALDTAWQHGCEVLVWGVRPAQVADLIDLGVGAVCVDEVAETVAAVPPEPAGR